MSNTKTYYRTGETCQQAGNYVCEAGEKSRLQEGDRFPECPVNRNETTWSKVE